MESKFKFCNDCSSDKLISEFYKNKRSKDGFAAYCKSCANKRNYDYAEKNKEKVNKLNLKSYYKNLPVRRNKELIYYQNNKHNISEKYFSVQDGNYHVYLLPEEHYCGQTNNPLVRKKAHNYYGRITKGMEVVMSFNNRKDALQLESCFHKLGWYGG